MDGDRGSEFTPFYTECAEIAYLKVHDIYLLLFLLANIW